MSNLFLSMLSMSLTAGYSILAVLIVRLLLRKAPKKYSYFLWGVVAFRLCCPVSFSSTVSLFRLRLPGISPSLTADPSAALADIAPASGLPAVLRNPASPQMWLILGAVLWLAGAAALAAYGLISYIRLTCRLRTAVRLEGNVFQSEYVYSPFILGIVRPKIYIPYYLDSQTLHYVLLHENYHVKRCDHILKMAAYLLLSLHWFNPLCWLAFHLCCKDMEMSCDEHVLGREEHASGDYSEALLSFALRGRFPSPGPLAFGETDIKKRVLHILHWKPPRPVAALLSALLCLAVVFVCAANPIAADPRLSDTNTTEDDSSPDTVEGGDLPNTAEDNNSPDTAENGDLPDTTEDVGDDAYSDTDGSYSGVPDTDGSYPDAPAADGSYSHASDTDGLLQDESYSHVADSSMAAGNENASEITDPSAYGDLSENHHSERHRFRHHGDQ